MTEIKKGVRGSGVLMEAVLSLKVGETHFLRGAKRENVRDAWLSHKRRHPEFIGRRYEFYRTPNGTVATRCE